jgi:hypothetical protein
MSGLHNKNLWHRRARAQLRMQPLFVEHRGFDDTIGADRWPIDPRHPVYRNS